MGGCWLTGYVEFDVHLNTAWTISEEIFKIAPQNQHHCIHHHLCHQAGQALSSRHHAVLEELALFGYVISYKLINTDELFVRQIVWNRTDKVHTCTWFQLLPLSQILSNYIFSYPRKLCRNRNLKVGIFIAISLVFEKKLCQMAIWLPLTRQFRRIQECKSNRIVYWKERKGWAEDSITWPGDRVPLS